MLKRNQVYTCSNQKCEPYLFQGGILLEFTIDGKRYSLDPYAADLHYYSSDGDGPNTNDIVVCPHCGDVCVQKEVSLVLDVKPQDVAKKIETLDARISELMKKFEGK